MKISQIIKILEENKANYGDLKCYIKNMGSDKVHDWNIIKIEKDCVTDSRVISIGFLGLAFTPGVIYEGQ